jgi:hypothetical protein
VLHPGCRADRQITDHLDMHEAMRPSRLDQRSLDEPADREMQMQPVIDLVPLRHPGIRERPTAKFAAQAAEELLTCARTCR